MTKKWCLVLVSATLFLSTMRLFADEVIDKAGQAVVVIVSTANPVTSLSIDQVNKFYENDILHWDNGKRVVLYDLRTQDEARKKFSTIVLGKDPEKVAMEWANKKITNTAKNPPSTVRSAVLLQERVAQNPNAIGYLLKSELTSKGVKIVTTIE
jgi:ABC-type phosphate transport system substrate-binding protein